MTAPAVTGGTFSSETPRSASTQCRYVAPAKTDTECSSITANTVSYTSSGWGTNFYTALAKAGSYVTATGNTSAPACATCEAGKYQGSNGSSKTSCDTCANWTFSGAGASSCTACPAVPDAVGGVAWTKASGTGWTTYSSCVVSQTPVNCASGSVKRTATSATAWGSTTLVTQLKSNAGYYASSTATSCTVCPVGSFCPASATSATACALGSYTGSTGQSACTACTNGTTTSGTGKTSCDATCANNNSYDNAWATASWSNNSVANLCKISNCKAGSSYSSATGTNYAGSCTQCSAGTYVSSSAHTTTSCSALTDACYGSAGATSACPNSCDDLTAPAVTGGTFSSETPRSASTQCRYVAPAKTDTECSSITANTVSYTSSGWGTNFYTALAKAGSYVTATGNTSAPACATCEAGKYQGSNGSSKTSCDTCANWTFSGAGASSCTACPALTSGWAKVDSTGTGWTTYTSCKQKQTPANCSAGVIQQTAASATTWGGSSVTTALKASQNYYVNNTACSACSGLGGGLYKNSASGNTGGASACYATTTDGKYISATSNAALQTCPKGDYCPATTLYWSNTGGNKDCPSGYTDGGTGYSKQSQCLMSVAGGKYVAKANESAASGTCAAGYYKPEHTVTYGGTSECIACSGATYAANTGQASCTVCPTATNNASKATGYLYWNTGGTADHTTVSGCYVTYENEDLDDGSMSLYYCYADTDAETSGEYGVDGTSKGCWVYWDKLKCDGGYYNKNYSTSSNYDFTNKTISALKTNACISVGTGYWSANDALTRTQCTAPLTTIGYGTGANEADDCGRKLHAGSNVVYLRSEQRSTPSLRVKVGDETFFGALSESLSGALKVNKDGKEYSVVNDWQ